MIFNDKHDAGWHLFTDIDWGASDAPRIIAYSDGNEFGFIEKNFVVDT